MSPPFTACERLAVSGTEASARQEIPSSSRPRLPAPAVRTLTVPVPLQGSSSTVLARNGPRIGMNACSPPLYQAHKLVSLSVAPRTCAAGRARMPSSRKAEAACPPKLCSVVVVHWPLGSFFPGAGVRNATLARRPVELNKLIIPPGSRLFRVTLTGIGRLLTTHS